MDGCRTRRRFLGSFSAGSIALLAGCSGVEAPSPPPANAKPKALVPDPPADLSFDEYVPQVWTGQYDRLEAAIAAVYHDESGNPYSINVSRYASPSAAEDVGWDAIGTGGWDIYVVNGNFGFAADGDDQAIVKEFLSNSSYLTEEYVSSTNMVG